MVSADSPEDYAAVAQLAAMGWLCTHFRYNTEQGVHWRLYAQKEHRVIQRDVLITRVEMRRAVSPPDIKLAKLTAAWDSMLEAQLRWEQECG